jgi:hypothetical protein
MSWKKVAEDIKQNQAKKKKASSIKQGKTFAERIAEEVAKHIKGKS